MFLYFLTIWPILYLLLNNSSKWYESISKTTDIKIKRNFIACFHTCTALTLSFLYYIYPDSNYKLKLFNFSSSYFGTFS